MVLLDEVVVKFECVCSVHLSPSSSFPPTHPVLSLSLPLPFSSPPTLLCPSLSLVLSVSASLDLSRYVFLFYNLPLSLTVTFFLSVHLTLSFCLYTFLSSCISK